MGPRICEFVQEKNFISIQLVSHLNIRKNEEQEMMNILLREPHVGLRWFGMDRNWMDGGKVLTF